MNRKGAINITCYIFFELKPSRVEILLRADVYVHPSYIDNSPNSLCKAQILGVPVISCNVGGISSLIEQKKWDFFPTNTPFELAYWIKELFYNETFSKIISRNGYEVAKRRYDIESIFE